MHRSNLIELLESFAQSRGARTSSQALSETCAVDSTADFTADITADIAHNGSTAERFLEFVRQAPRCFDRTFEVGHVTGSAWVLSPDASAVLLTHHRKLNKWLQLGGHADGDSDIRAVALREAIEESGIESIHFVNREIFDLDIHEIPARASELTHLHFDVRFLLQATKWEFHVSDESHTLAWIPYEELPKLVQEDSMLRMHRQWGLKRNGGPRNAALQG